MFTGIISNTVKIKNSRSVQEGLLVSFHKPKYWDDLTIGESIATSGVCLTVSEIHEEYYDCILVPETLSKSIFGEYIPISVNLERSLKVDERFGGHFVQGHVDCIGKVDKIIDRAKHEVYVSYPSKFDPLVISKGSICINGVSLTVVQVVNNTLSVAVIPHTLTNTTIGTLVEGSMVNLEFDVIGKYIAKQLKVRG
jgi:riboflavin synthase